jgi:hypothetical protein
MTGFGTPFFFSNIDNRISCFTRLKLLTYRINGSISLIDGEVWIEQSFPLRPSERVFRISLNFTSVWFLLDDITAGPHHIGSRNQGLQTRKPRVISSIAKRELLWVRDFWFQIGIVLGPWSSSHGFGVVLEPGLQPDSRGDRPGFPQDIRLHRVEVLVLAEIVVVFSLASFVFTFFSPNQMRRIPFVLEFVSYVVIGPHRFLSFN